MHVNKHSRSQATWEIELGWEAGWGLVFLFFNIFFVVWWGVRNFGYVRCACGESLTTPLWRRWNWFINQIMFAPVLVWQNITFYTFRQNQLLKEPLFIYEWKVSQSLTRMVFLCQNSPHVTWFGIFYHKYYLLFPLGAYGYIFGFPGKTFQRGYLSLNCSHSNTLKFLISSITNAPKTH